MSSKITKVIELNPHQNHPVILDNFETYLEHRQHDMKCVLAHNPSKGTNAGVGNLLLVTGEKKMYYGHIDVNPSEPEQAEPLLHTYVAKRNKETGKMRLYEVRTSTLMHVSHDRPSNNSQPSAEMDERRLLNMQRKLNPRAARLEEKRKNNRIDLSVMEEKLQSMLSETVVKNVDEAAPVKITVIDDDLKQELQAKRNPNAKTLRDLYNAERLLGTDVWRSLTTAAKTTLQMPVEYLSMANTYLENKVKAVMQSSEPTTEPNLAIVRTCLYMDVMVRLMGRKAHNLAKRGNNVSPFTKVLDATIRQGFLQRVRKELNTHDEVTKYTRKKALVYYLALLFALEQRDAIDMGTIHKSLEMPRNELVMYASVVGARFNSKVDQFVIGNVQVKTEEEQAADALDAFKTAYRGKRGRRN
ncbi:uncharacterized protein LOC126564771 [Anopheles maculipalpis]|uniref:uncharacterized protein LOC126564771 n=1 Tax=Anopheles maculipalpis TaxID=1496333 RepID=UPI002158EAB5|nr:uncharacterized protein LOC126564771 [Anopheles maculipalpis]